MVTQSWFRNLWTTSKKHDFNSLKEHIAVLAFEAASLMTKLLHLWQSLTDKQVAKLREEIMNSEGIKKLVSENDDYIGRLMCMEMMENLLHVAKAVNRLSKKCDDPLLKTFEQAFNDLIKTDSDAYGWQYSWKKMGRKAKKMEKLVIVNANLYQEMETLADLEQALKRIKANDNADSVTRADYEKRVAWKRREVKHLKENSLWNRTYDYTILLLARSVFTVYARIGQVFGSNNVAAVGANKDSKVMDIDNNRHSHSTVFMHSMVYPSENCGAGNSISMSGPLPRANKTVDFRSGPIGNSIPVSSPVHGKHDGSAFFSGPLGRSSTRSKSTLKLWKFRDKSQDSRDKNPQRRSKGITMSGPLVRHAMGGISSQADDCESNPINFCSGISDGANVRKNIHRITSPGIAGKSKLLNPPPETLGAAALALHYANIVIFIEKLAATPHLIGKDARDDLYNMLPANIRSSLRAKLKPFAKGLSSSVYDTALAAEWKDAISETLGWLSPLAHNMIRWQSERSFEHQNLVSRTNVLLIQTLYFAKQERTEAAIAELLIGLNYIWRLGRDINAKSLAECISGQTYDDYLYQ